MPDPTYPYSPSPYHSNVSPGVGFLGAPRGAPRAYSNAEIDNLLKNPTSWQKSQMPDPEVPPVKPRKGIGLYNNWHLTTPRQIFERNYGPTLTEKLRQNARSYQESHPEDIANYASGGRTLMPNYSREYFDYPTWVRQSPDPGRAYARWRGTEGVNLSKLTVEPAISMYTNSRNAAEGYDRGTFDAPTPMYNSVLQHEATHRLQDLDYALKDKQRLMPGENPALASPSAWEYNGKFPYSRFPTELAPMVSQAKLDYYRYLNALNSGKSYTYTAADGSIVQRSNDSKPNPTLDVDEAMNFNNPESYQRFLDWMSSETGAYHPSDVKWILDLAPSERDLYFKGIVQRNTANSPNAPKMAAVRGPYSHYAPRGPYSHYAPRSPYSHYAPH